MKIAVDKNSISCKKKDGHEYIYIFENESLEDLLKTNLHCIRYGYCDYVDINLTNFNIDCIKKASPNDKNYDIIPPKKEFKIGIIIPNYNYEHTLKKCIKSVLNQTYNNYEIVIVDDCSTDKSVKIAEKFAKKYPRVKLVELKQKRYNGGARNEGYLHLSDDVDYVFGLDSDDWLLDEECLENVNDKLQKEPDVLFTGLSKYRDGVTSVEFVPDYKNKYEALKGWSGCGKVIKKSLATKQECLYNEGTLKEDRNQHCRICIYMNSFELLKKPIYVWNQDNRKSVTTIREKTIWGTSTIRHYADTKQLYLQERGKDPVIDEYLLYRVNLCKNEMDMGGDKQW